MDGNKDDALKCLRIGKDALDAGDRARAFRFFSKAQRLDPTLPVDDLLSSINGTCESKAPHPPRSPDKGDKMAGGPSAPSSSKAEAAEPPPPPSGGSSSKAYTEEQLLVVKQIKKQKDYYQILGLERSCSVEDVRKAYRKLSLKVHPDKNKAPGAEEAFKAVSKAFQCLSSEDSRSRYDTEGTDEPATHIRRARRQDMYNGFNGFYEADIDAEEIFRNFFFGGGMHQTATTPFGTFRFRTGGMAGQAAQGGGHASSNSGLRMCLQVLPVILLLLLNFLPSSEPPYALSQSYSFEQRLETPRGVPFFVKPGKFEQQYPRNSAERLALEERVEKEYVAIVSQNCRLELQRQQWGFGNQTPHCDLLQKYNDAVAAA